MNEYDNLLQDGQLPSGNEYDEILRNQERSTRTQVNVASQTDLDPDTAANIIKLADRRGLPRDVVERQLSAIQKDENKSLNEYDAYLSHPAIAKFLSDPYNQATVKDDGSFTIMDKLFNGVARSYQNMSAGVSAIKLDVAQRRLDRYKAIDAAIESKTPLSEADTAFFEAHTPEQWAASKAGLLEGRAEAAQSIETSSKIAQAIPHADPEVIAAMSAKSASEFWRHFSQKPVEFILTVGAESALPSLSIAAAGLVSGGSIPIATTVAGAGSYGTEYGSSLIDGIRKAGVDVSDRAAVEKAVQDKELMKTVAQRAFDRAGPIALLDAISGGLTGFGGRSIRGAVGSMGLQGVLGGGGEALAQLNSGEEFQFGEIAAEFLGEFVTAPIEVGGAAAGRALELRAQRMQAKENQAFFGAIGATAEASKLREKLPTVMQNLVDDLTADGPISNVYINPNTFTEYFQSQGIDPRRAASELLDDGNALDEAIQSGQDLQIPLGAYTAKLAGTKHNIALSRDLKFNPEDLSVRETEDLIKSETAAEQSKKDDTTENASVKDSVTQMLQKAGYEARTAETLAAQMGAFFDAQAERTGRKSGLDLLKEYVLKILGRKDVSEQLGGVKSFDQPAFHGSPHIFEKFSLENIGGGEGAQVHGWGLYFGKTKSIINSRYKNRLAKPGIVGLSEDIKPGTMAYDILSNPDFLLPIFNERVSGPRVALLNSKITETKGNIKNLRARASELTKLKDVSAAAAVQDRIAQHEIALKELERIRATGDIKVEPMSRLYEVDIKADDSQLLNLDDPLPNLAEPPAYDEDLIRGLLQQPVVQDAIHHYGPKSGRPITGRDLYRALVRAAGSSDGRIWNAIGADEATEAKMSSEEAASRYLLSQGIKGLSYVGKQDGPAMVIFDESAIEIVSYEQSAGDKPRGRLIKYGDYEYSIELLKDANLSTFLHESGHLYLEILKNLAKDSPAVQADLDILLKWMGIESVDQIERKHHEQFAEGLETYFMEGKAPSVELRTVFARFRAWLMAIYSKLRTGLNDEVRGVMDRMFATESQILAARAENQLTQMFTTAEQAGMQPAQFEKYLKTIQDANRKATEELQTELMQQWTREQKAWWKEQREALYSEIEAERIKQNDVVAYYLLRFGQTVDGQELPDAQRIKLDRDSLVDMYGVGAPIINELRGLNMYRVEGGVHPDVAAEFLGFRSGDELVQAVTKAKNYKAEISARADEVMKQRHGDMLKDGTIADAARAAVLNEKRSEILHAELKALVKKRNEVAPFVQAERNIQRTQTMHGLATIRGVPSLDTFRKIAQARIAALQIRALSPNKFLVAARRASTTALEAATKNDFSAAATAKQQEIFNLEMYREARNALNEVDNAVDYARGLATTKSRQRIGKAGADYLEQIDALLNRFDFTPTPMAEESKRARLADWITQKERQGIIVDLDPQIINEAFKRPYKTLTYEEFIGVRDSLKHIEHLSRLKNKLLKSKDKRDLQVIVDDLESTIRENFNGKAPEKTGIRLPQNEPMRFVDQFFASHRKMASYARQMDGFKDNGPVWQALVLPLNEVSNNEATMIHEAGVKLKEIFQPYLSIGRTSGLYKRVHEASINAPLSKMERIMVALNIGNEDNRTKLKNGYGWTDSQIDAIVSPLTAEDWKFVQSIWDFIDSYWPQIEAKEQRVNGVAPEKVAANPVHTKHGDFPGGYFPLKYEDRLSPGAYANGVKESAEAMMRGAATRATTKRGHTKERTQNVKMPVRLDFGVIFEHTHQVIHDLAFHEYLIDANKLLGNKQFQNAVHDTYGDVVYDQLRGTIEDVAAGETPATNAFEKSINWFRKGTSIAAMGWNLSTAALQPLGFSQSIVRIGAPWVFKGFTRIFRDAVSLENSAKWVHDKSEFMRNRHVTMGREINEIRNSIRGQTMSGVVSDSYFYFIYKMQQIVDIPTWIGAYEKAMHSGVDTDRAIALADQAVLDSQGGGQIKDLAQIQRGGPLMRLWTNFYNFFNTTYNLTTESVLKTNFRSPSSIGRLAVDLLLLYTVPAVIGFMLKSALRDDEPPDDLLERLLHEQASYVLGTMVGLREFSSVIQGYYGYEGPAGTRFYSEMVNLIKQAGQGEADAAAWKSLNQVAGILLHYPAGQVQRTVDGYVALSEGRTNSPTALMFGPPKENK